MALLRSGTRDKRGFTMGTQQNQELDRQVRRGANFLDSDLSRSRPDSLSFEKDLSPEKQGENEAVDPPPEGASNRELTFFEREKIPNPTATSEETTRAVKEPAGAKPPGRKENPLPWETRGERSSQSRRRAKAQNNTTTRGNFEQRTDVLREGEDTKSNGDEQRDDTGDERTSGSQTTGEEGE